MTNRNVSTRERIFGILSEGGKHLHKVGGH